MAVGLVWWREPGGLGTGLFLFANKDVSQQLLGAGRTRDDARYGLSHIQLVSSPLFIVQLCVKDPVCVVGIIIWILQKVGDCDEIDNLMP